MKNMRLTFLLLIVLFQVLGFISIFFNLFIAISSFALSGLSLFAVIILLIVDRIKEVEEDKKRDYSDY